MQSKLKQFYEKSFKLDFKIYVVEDYYVKQLKAYIKTDRRTFVLYESELDELLEKIEFVDPEIVTSETVVMAKPKPVSYGINAQITEQNCLSARMCKKLEEVFDDLTGEPDEKLFKKAQNMVGVANSIVNIQLANYKYLTLNRS